MYDFTFVGAGFFNSTVAFELSNRVQMPDSREERSHRRKLLYERN